MKLPVKNVADLCLNETAQVGVVMLVMPSALSERWASQISYALRAQDDKGKLRAPDDDTDDEDSGL